MTPVCKAEYHEDVRYPVMLIGPVWWEKMTIKEALDLSRELREAADQAQKQPYLEVA